MNPVHDPKACGSTEHFSQWDKHSSLFLFPVFSWVLLILQLCCLVGQFLHRCLGDEDVAMRLLPLFKEELFQLRCVGFIMF